MVVAGFLAFIVTFRELVTSFLLFIVSFLPFIATLSLRGIVVARHADVTIVSAGMVIAGHVDGGP